LPSLKQQIALPTRGTGLAAGVVFREGVTGHHPRQDGPAIDSPAPTNETGHALRVASAAAGCLVLVELLHLEHGNLAVWTTHMVMAQYPFTAFQKGVERILGRGLGLLAGLVLLTLGQNAVVLVSALKALGLLAFFYLHFSGRLAYTFLNAGLYLAVILEIGRANPEAAIPQARELFLAIVLGVAVAELVVWVSGAERDLRIHAGGGPVWPLEGGRVRHSLMLVVTVLLTQFVTRTLDLPTSTALVSVMILTITPDLQSLLLKGRLRVVGALLAAAWALLAWTLLAQAPHFPLFLLLLFLGMFLAAYLTRTGGRFSYAGLQMGLVLPLILVVPPGEFGSLRSVVVRLEGVLIALATSLLVGGAWVLFGSRGGPPSPAPAGQR
jgi:uncharacterized membrane protein YccC